MIHVLILILTIILAPVKPFAGYESYLKCLTDGGPGTVADYYYCGYHWDSDRDGDVDLTDWAYFTATEDWP